jgi:hypothetical protein
LMAICRHKSHNATIQYEFVAIRTLSVSEAVL